MVGVEKAKVFRGWSGWTWVHANCDATGEDALPGFDHPPGWVWHGDIRPTQPDAFKRAQRHMEKEHGLGVRAHGQHHREP